MTESNSRAATRDRSTEIGPNVTFPDSAAAWDAANRLGFGDKRIASASDAARPQHISHLCSIDAGRPLTCYDIHHRSRNVRSTIGCEAEMSAKPAAGRTQETAYAALPLQDGGIRVYWTLFPSDCFVRFLLRCCESREKPSNRWLELVFQLQPPGTVGFGIGEIPKDAGAAH
jgi:hypothetical protein